MSCLGLVVFFQAEDGIRGRDVTGVQTCALPISKQVALARPPKDLVIHINRSIFDDFGSQRKNTASVRFPPAFDLGRWCLGIKSSNADVKEFEHWSMTSTESM